MNEIAFAYHAWSEVEIWGIFFCCCCRSVDHWQWSWSWRYQIFRYPVGCGGGQWMIGNEAEAEDTRFSEYPAGFGGGLDWMSEWMRSWEGLAEGMSDWEVKERIGESKLLGRQTSLFIFQFQNSNTISTNTHTTATTSSIYVRIRIYIFYPLTIYLWRKPLCLLF